MEEAMTKTQLISIYSDGFFSDGTLQISNVGVKGVLYTAYLRGQQIPGAQLDLRTASASSLVQYAKQIGLPFSLSPTNGVMCCLCK